MPLPLILAGIGVAVTAIASGWAIHKSRSATNDNNRAEHRSYAPNQGENRNDDNERISSNQNRDSDNISILERHIHDLTIAMDRLGDLELSVLEDLLEYTNLIEEIRNLPSFASLNDSTLLIQRYYFPEYIRQASLGASVLHNRINALQHISSGTIGGFAAAGAVRASFIALNINRTSNEFSISLLSGPALLNATLKALHEDMFSRICDNIEFTPTIFDVSFLGIGIVIGDVIYILKDFHPSNISDISEPQMSNRNSIIQILCKRIKNMITCANIYYNTIKKFHNRYQQITIKIKSITKYKTDWNLYSILEKRAIENYSALVSILFNMCEVQITKASRHQNKSNSMKSINYEGIRHIKKIANETWKQIAPAFEALDMSNPPDNAPSYSAENGNYETDIDQTVDNETDIDQTVDDETLDDETGIDETGIDETVDDVNEIDSNESIDDAEQTNEEINKYVFVDAHDHQSTITSDPNLYIIDLSYDVDEF